MNKFFLFLLSILPVAAFGADFSDCEVIGHKVYNENVEKWMTQKKIWKEEKKKKKCLNNTKTAEQCAQEIDNINKLMAENYVIYKCPATQSRVSQKDAPKVTTSVNYVYNDGTPVDSKTMIEDSNFVYIFRMGAGLLGAFTYTEDYQDYILGTPESDGMNLSMFK